jgi:hypothetical protein
MGTTESRHRSTEARNLLAPVRARFPGGETSADLREADELLQRLN